LTESSNLGGAIFVEAGARVVVVASELYDNTADDSGGALYLDTGEDVEAILENVMLRNNLASAFGAGTYWLQLRYSQ
jgi:hypothetical protein